MKTVIKIEEKGGDLSVQKVDSKKLMQKTMLSAEQIKGLEALGLNASALKSYKAPAAERAPFQGPPAAALRNADLNVICEAILAYENAYIKEKNSYYLRAASKARFFIWKREYKLA